MRLPVVAGLLLVVLGGAMPAAELVIDNFDYPDAAAAGAQWRPNDQSPPVQVAPRDGGQALVLPCPFTRDVARSHYDCAVNLDLRRFGRFTLDINVPDPAACDHFTIYFRSGEGWYGAGISAEPGWRTVTLTKAQFGAEDQPAGWGAISGIRLAQWKSGEADTQVTVDNLVAYSSEIAVVLSTRSEQEAPAEARTVRGCAEDMQSLLESAGIHADLITDEDVVGGGLEGRRVAIFAYSPFMAPEVLEAARQFVAAGGKAMVLYSLDPGMGELLGVRTVGYKRADPEGVFADIAFEAPDVAGLPPKVGQDSWNINVVEPAGPNARVIGWWQDAAGQRSTDPAVVLSDTGLYFAHILTGADLETKRQMMTALLGHFVPEVWTEATRQALAAATRVGTFTSLADLRDYATAAAAGTGREARVAERLKKGEEHLSAAQTASQEGRPAEACAEAAQARQALREVYAMAQHSRTGEFRAVWNHSGTGAFAEGWEASIKNLADAGFNAVVPNMWWAGVAHYDSEYLPHSETFRQRGDQIAQCVAAAHARGIEVHPWKVNWNLGNAPADFVEKLRGEGRTMVSADGQPVDWLCPSNPANFQLEYDTMLEVARKYDVDGIHFDYIRYLDDSVCYCSGCRGRFEAELGRPVANWPADCYSGPLHDQYRDFRCEQITRLVKAVSEEAHRLKPYLKVSAAVFSDYPGCREYVGQDWVLWVKEGYLDFICPMDYTDSNEGFRRTVARQVAQVNGLIPLYAGIGASAPGLPADQVIAQVDIARETGTDGFIVFEHNATTARDQIPALGQGATAEPTYLPHHAPRVQFHLPAAPSPADGAVHLRARADLVAGMTLQLPQTHRGQVRNLSARVQLQTVEGAQVGKPLADVTMTEPPPGEPLTAEVSAPPAPGRLRLALAGELRFADGTKPPFIVRSVPFVFDAE